MKSSSKRGDPGRKELEEHYMELSNDSSVVLLLMIEMRRYDGKLRS